MWLTTGSTGLNTIKRRQTYDSYSQGSVIKAYKTLNRLCEEKMPVRLAYSLFSMRKSTESFYSFQVEREQEIFKEYVNGMESEALTFKTDEDKEKFVKEMTDLVQMEVMWMRNQYTFRCL